MKLITYYKPRYCSKCPIASAQEIKPIPYEFSVDNPSIIFVGEAPENEENEIGRPFIGQSGKLLREIINDLGIDDFGIVNTVGCRPSNKEDDTYRTPTKEEIIYCSTYAKDVIKQSKCSRKIVLLGKVARDTFLPELENTSMISVINNNPYQKDGIYYFVNYHPSYILNNHNNQVKELFRSVIEKAYNYDPFEVETTNLNLYIFNRSQLEQAVNILMQFDELAFDIESTTLPGEENFHLVGLGFGNDKLQVYIDFSDSLESLTKKEKSLLLKLFDSTKMYVYNVGFEMIVIERLLGKRYYFEDVYAYAAILNKSTSLGKVAKYFLGANEWKDAPKMFAEYWRSEDLKFLIPKKYYKETLVKVSIYDNDWFIVPTEIMAKYNALDVYWTWRLKEHLLPKVQKFKDVYLPQFYLGALMNSYGLAWDEELFQKLYDQYNNYVDKLKREAIKFEKFRRNHLKLIKSKITPVNVLREFRKDVKAPHKIKVKETEKMSWEQFTEYLENSEDDAILREYVKNYLNNIDDKILSELNSDPDKADFGSPQYMTQVFWDTIFTDKLKLAVILYYPIKSNIIEKPSKLSINVFEELKIKNPDALKYGINKYEEMRSSMDASYVTTMFDIFDMFWDIDYESIDMETGHIENHNLDPEEYESFRFLVLYRIWKKVDKMIDSYLEGSAGKGSVRNAIISDLKSIPILTNKITGKYILNPRFFACRAATNRWTSGYHTIPTKTEVKALTTTRFDDTLIIHADYSQMEVRVLAAFANESNLMKAFEEGKDIHKYVASQIYQKPEEKISDEERRFAKTATFSILYGKGVKAFAKEYMGGDYKKAEEFFNMFFGAFPGIKTYVDSMHKIGETTGRVPTLFGDTIPAKRPTEMQNYPIQSSASTLAALSGWQITEISDKLNIESIPLAFVHDALEFEFKVKDLFEFLIIFKSLAEEIPKQYGVPAKIDMEIGTRVFFMFEIEKLTSDELILIGNEIYINELLERLKNYNIEVYDTGKIDYTEKKELLVSRRGYSSHIGKKFKIYKVIVRR